MTDNKMDIRKGQRLPLAQLGAENQVEIGLHIAGIRAAIDFACFGLDAQQKLSNDAYMTFFNQPKTPCGAVALSNSAADAAVFLCNLNQLPAAIDRLIFTAAIEGAETMQQIQSGYLRFMVAGNEVARFSFSGADFQQEKALMLGELYRKDGAWRFCAVGQGFNGGLAALVEHFGGEVLEKKAAPTHADVSHQTVAANASSAAVTQETTPSEVVLSKVTLEKRGDKISLAKPVGASGHGHIVCHLNWSASDSKKKGLFGGAFGGNTRIDLDIGCLYELSDGTKSVVQALGNAFGAYETFPFIHLAGDDRTGTAGKGEFLYINGNHFHEMRRICIFTYIYEGAVNWKQANAMVTVSVPGQPVIEMYLDAPKSNLNMCAIAMLENDHGLLKLTKLSEYFRGHPELDKHYHWGMRWQAGRK